MSKGKTDWSVLFKGEDDEEVASRGGKNEKGRVKSSSSSKQDGVWRRGSRTEERSPSPDKSKEKEVWRRGSRSETSSSSSSGRGRSKEGDEDDRKGPRSSAAKDIIKGFDRIKREDSEYDRYQDKLANMSRSEAADIFLYVKRDAKNRNILDANSQIASALARTIGNEVYVIIIDDIEGKRPPWLTVAPTAFDRIDRKIYRGGDAINFLKSVTEETPADFSRGHRAFESKVTETWTSGQGVSKIHSGYTTRKKKVTPDEFMDYMSRREAQDRRLNRELPRFRGKNAKNLPSMRADADLTDEMKLRTGLNPVYREMMERKRREHQAQIARELSRRGRI